MRRQPAGSRCSSVADAQRGGGQAASMSLLTLLRDGPRALHLDMEAGDPRICAGCLCSVRLGRPLQHILGQVKHPEPVPGAHCVSLSQSSGWAELVRCGRGSSLPGREEKRRQQTGRRAVQCQLGASNNASSSKSEGESWQASCCTAVHLLSSLAVSRQAPSGDHCTPAARHSAACGGQHHFMAQPASQLTFQEVTIWGLQGTAACRGQG